MTTPLTSAHPVSVADYAAVYAALGFRPIRIAKDGKRPIDQGWTTLPKVKPEEAFREFEGYTGNIGLLTNGFIVVDCDTKTPGGGVEAFEGYASKRGQLPPTFTATTQSGGRHYVFALPPGMQCKNGVHKENLPGVDIRATGGQIVVEPSTIEGRRYEWQDVDLLSGECPTIAPLPTWLYELAGVASEDAHASAPRQPVEVGSITEGGRNDTLYRIACGMRRRGADVMPIYEALQAVNAHQCTPMLELAELEQITLSACKYSPAPDLPEPPPRLAYLPPLEAYQADPPSLSDIDRIAPPPFDDGLGSGKFGIIQMNEITSDRELVPAGLIEDVLPEKGVFMLYGPASSGKTFAMLDMCFAVAQGIPWQDKCCKQTGVLYVASESPASVRQRMKAYVIANNKNAFPFYLAQRAFDINSDAAIIDLIADVRMLEGKNNCRIGMVIVDTLAASMPGQDENNAGDMSRTLANLLRLQHALDCLLGLNHHAGKDLSRGARGWSGLRGWVDTEIAITPANDDGIHALEVTKHRTMAGAGGRFGFSLEPISIGINEWGRDVVSCVLRGEEPPREEQEGESPVKAEKEAGEIGKAQRHVLRYLTERGPSCSAASIVADMCEHGYAKRTAYRSIDVLVGAKEITRDGRVLSICIKSKVY